MPHSYTSLIILRFPQCVCKCVCVKHQPEEQTQIPANSSLRAPDQNVQAGDVPPDIVVSVIRSSSGFFQGTLSAVSTVSGHFQPSLSRMLGGGDDGYSGDPPPYEAPPSYKAATEQPFPKMLRAETV